MIGFDGQQSCASGEWRDRSATNSIASSSADADTEARGLVGEGPCAVDRVPGTIDQELAFVSLLVLLPLSDKVRKAEAPRR